MAQRNGVSLTNYNRSRRRYFSHCIPLHKAALKGNWKAAEGLISDDPNLVRAHITEGGLTALHIASMEGKFDFAAKLLHKMDASDLEITNNRGNTALCFAAAAGNANIVNLMLRNHPSLANIGCGDGGGGGGGGGDGGGGGGGGGGDDGFCTPLSMAALLGHHEVSQLLYNETDFDSWDQRDKVSLLTLFINSGLYGLATQIVDRHRNLAVVANNNNETPLEILARTPGIFSRRSNESDAYMLFEHLWYYARLYQEDDTEAAAETTVISPKLLFASAESENDEFLVEIINRYPDFLYTMNSLHHSIFHIAVLHRNVQVFNLIYELNGIKALTAAYIDTDGNNMLHLAAKLAPQERLNAIPGGTALQMQQEVMWFKEVEKIVPLSYRSMKNSKNQTPHELFFLEHEKMMSKGEETMKKTAKPFMLVAMLIPTLAFATAVTIPVGYNNNGNNKDKINGIKFFMAFPISIAVALFSSVMSVLMLLYILTSRCNNKFFLVSPICLVCGLCAFFVSMGSIIVAFCTCPLFEQRGSEIARTLLMPLVLVVMPAMLMVLGPLLVSILRSTFSSRLLFGSNNRLFSEESTTYMGYT